MLKKVGLMPCNGMSFIMSTVARDVCRTVSEVLLPGKICFIDTSCIIAGIEEEMETVRQVPILAVDGCKLKCAVKALDKRGIIPDDVIIITDIMRASGLSLRGEDRNRLGPAGQSLVSLVSKKTADRAARLLYHMSEKNLTIKGYSK